MLRTLKVVKKESKEKQGNGIYSYPPIYFQNLSILGDTDNADPFSDIIL